VPGATVPETPKEPDYSREAMVHEQYRTLAALRMTALDGRDSIRARSCAERSRRADRWGKLVFGYNAANEKMEINYVRVKKSDGKVITATATRCRTLPRPSSATPHYTDTREKHVTFRRCAGRAARVQRLHVHYNALCPGNSG